MGYVWRGWSRGWINGKKAHWPVGLKTRTLFICTVTYPNAHTISVLLIALSLLRAQAGVGAWVTFIPVREEKHRYHLYHDPQIRFWTCTLNFSQQPGDLWWALTAPTDGQQDTGKGELVLSADEQETFLSIAAKPALFISIQSAPEMP